MVISYRTQNILVTFFDILTVPFMLLNFFGGIVSGIWLAVLGEWKEIFTGVILA
jgi:hypothetical protein